MGARSQPRLTAWGLPKVRHRPLSTPVKTSLGFNSASHPSGEITLADGSVSPDEAFCQRFTQRGN